MFRKLFLILAFVSFISQAFAQRDTSHLRISLLTCGTGPEVWETFGHTAIRVVDSTTGTDIVFNYGTFEFDDDFTAKFVRGKLLYYVSYYAYELFLDEYISANRSVREQLLLLDGKTKTEFYEFLKENSKDENKFYLYDFFFDNCATRIRDIFPKVLGDNFRFGKTVAAKEPITFREIMNYYYYAKHWERFGVNLLLGSKIDKQMNNEDIMFLPDYLSKGVEDATYNGKKISTKPVQVLPGSPKPPAGLNQPLVVMLLLSLLTILGLILPQLEVLGKIMTFLLLFISGLLGCLMLIMWFGTDHQACANNYNLLWALPTNLLLAFLPKQNKGKYAIVGIILLLLALIFHITGMQEMPLTELSPLLLALLFVYGRIYRKSNGKYDRRPAPGTNG